MDFSECWEMDICRETKIEWFVSVGRWGLLPVFDHLFGISPDGLFRRSQQGRQNLHCLWAVSRQRNRETFHTYCTYMYIYMNTLTNTQITQSIYMHSSNKYLMYAYMFASCITSANYSLWFSFYFHFRFIRKLDVWGPLGSWEHNQKWKPRHVSPGGVSFYAFKISCQVSQYDEN